MAGQALLECLFVQFFYVPCCLNRSFQLSLPSKAVSGRFCPSPVGFSTGLTTDTKNKPLFKGFAASLGDLFSSFFSPFSKAPLKQVYGPSIPRPGRARPFLLLSENSEKSKKSKSSAKTLLP
jgi:hypothetical protein